MNYLLTLLLMVFAVQREAIDFDDGPLRISIPVDFNVVISIPANNTDVKHVDILPATGEIQEIYRYWTIIEDFHDPERSRKIKEWRAFEIEPYREKAPVIDLRKLRRIRNATGVMIFDVTESVLAPRTEANYKLKVDISTKEEKEK